MPENRNVDIDVAVVGGGLSGLSAARELVRAGLSVRLFEAKEYPGGRVQGGELTETERIELGGQWVGPTQDNVLALVKEFGLDVHPTHMSGDHLFYRLGQLARYDASVGPIPPVGQDALAEVGQIIVTLQALAEDMDPLRPWAHAKAAEWDAISFGEWARGIAGTDDARMLVDYVVRSTNAIEADEISLLHMVRYVAAAGNDDNKGSLLRVVVTADGASQWRIVGGSQGLVEHLAAELGDVISLASPVSRIADDGDGVALTVAGRPVRARKVIVAIPPAAAAEIDFGAEISAERARLQAELQRGGQIKVNVVYSEPFWRTEGLTGYVCSDTGPVQNVWDNTPASKDKGVLVAFIKGEAARALDQASDEEVAEAAVSALRTYFGDRAADVEAIRMRRWHTEPYIWGCPGGLPGPGLITAVGDALQAPAGHIHWAGTESATYWQGFMEGAVASGLREARIVTQALQGETAPERATALSSLAD